MVSTYMIYFSLLSAIGYLYECLAMVIWTGKWDNRGFLFGPVIPIYGAGALFGTILFTFIYKDYTPLSVFLISMFASAVLEYVVHYGLEKIFHAYWWDYSKSPLNINGRICLPASLGFGIAGLIIIYLVNPFLMPLLSKIPEPLSQFLALLMASLFGADLALTLSVLSDFIRKVENFDERINERMDHFVANHMNDSIAVGNHFYSAVDYLEESRKKHIDARIERAIDSMSGVRRLIISRIKGFKGGSASARLNDILRRMKNRIKRRKDE